MAENAVMSRRSSWMVFPTPPGTCEQAPGGWSGPPGTCELVDVPGGWSRPPVSCDHDEAPPAPLGAACCFSHFVTLSSLNERPRCLLSLNPRWESGHVASMEIPFLIQVALRKDQGQAGLGLSGDTVRHVDACRENAQKRDSRVEANAPDAVKQLREHGLQICRLSEVILPVSAFPVAVKSSIKSVDGKGYTYTYVCCTKSCNAGSGRGKPAKMSDCIIVLSKGNKCEPNRGSIRPRPRSRTSPATTATSWQISIPRILRRETLLEELLEKPKPVEHGMFDCFFIDVF